MIYLDNAATSFPKPPAVVEAIEQMLREGMGNPGRAGHRSARAAEQVIVEARLRLSRLINAESPEQIVFTLNGTDSLNMAIKGIVRDGDHVVTGVLEHNSVLRPLRGLVAQQRIELTILDADDAGYYRHGEVAGALRSNTRLVALTHGSNVLGTVQPIEEIGAIVRSSPAHFLVDAAQTMGAWPIDVRAAGIDLLASPGHKSLFGPAGIGVLYVAPDIELAPWREGGTGRDSGEGTHPKMLPHALEAGTPNVLGITGVLAGLRTIEEQTMEKIVAHGEAWTDRLLNGLLSVPGIEVVSKGLAGKRLPLISFRSSDLPPEDVGGVLDASYGIAVRTGLLCAPATHMRYHTHPEGTIRASASALTRFEDADALVSAVRELLSFAEPTIATFSRDAVP